MESCRVMDSPALKILERLEDVINTTYFQDTADYEDLCSVMMELRAELEMPDR